MQLSVTVSISDTLPWRTDSLRSLSLPLTHLFTPAVSHPAIWNGRAEISFSQFSTGTRVHHRAQTAIKLTRISNIRNIQWSSWRTQYPTQATGTHVSRTWLVFYLQHWSQNTFHFAGVGAKNVTLGVPRLKVGCCFEALQAKLPWFEQSFCLDLLAIRQTARANVGPRQTPDAPSSCAVSHDSARKARPV